MLTSCSSFLQGTPTPSGTPLTPVLVATDPSWAPFETVNTRTREIEGLDIDIFNEIAVRQAFRVEYKNVAWDPLLSGIAQGKYDAAISSIVITEDRKKDMLFSDPYFSAGLIVVAGKDNTTITGKDTLSGTVGVMKGTNASKELEKITTITLITVYEKIDLAFQDLLYGKLNAVVCDYPVALLYIGKQPEKLKAVGNVFTNENYGIAVAKGKTELLAKINSGLKAIKSEGFIDQATVKWFY